MSLKHLTASVLIGAVTAALNKPALHPDLDYCNQGLLNNLHPTQSTWDQWGAGWIPQACQKAANDAGLDPRDVTAWNVHYTDCGDAWTVCRHKNAQVGFIDMIDLFGRLPVQSRQWVRHVIALPDTGPHAYNFDSLIALFGDLRGNMNVMVHETGHSLDGQGAFSPDKPLNNAANWINNYNQDSAVPDPYAQTNQVENVAQNVVVSMFDRNVPGGFGSIEPNWNRIFHQYATLEWEADNGGGLLKPGGSCTHRLPNSAPVQVGTKRGIKRAPNVDLSDNVTVVEVKHFDSREHGCKYSHKK